MARKPETVSIQAEDRAERAGDLRLDEPVDPAQDFVERGSACDDSRSCRARIRWPTMHLPRRSGHAAILPTCETEVRVTV